MMIRRKISLPGRFALAVITALAAVVLVQGLGWWGEDPGSVQAAVGHEGDDDNGGSDRWWPSRWGADDEAGASNWITPAKVKEAVRLIEHGKIYELGRAYEDGMPVPWGILRGYKLVIPGGPSIGPFGKNKEIGNVEFITGELGQVGTQFDGLGHTGVQMGEPGNKNEMRYYNGFTETEVGAVYGHGLQKLGIEKIKPIFTRGILVDVAGLKGRMLEAGEEITLGDVGNALERQGMGADDIKPGDAVLFNTGWGSLWMTTDDERHNSGPPGIGLKVAEWLIDKKVTMVGSDTWCVEVVDTWPPVDIDSILVFPVHEQLIVKNGIPLHENLDLSGLAEDEVYEFAYIFVRVPFKGATGSPGSPIAVR